VETSNDTEMAALLAARQSLHAKLWDINHTKRPRSQKKLLNATGPLLAELQGNTVALRTAIVERVWREHPEWRRARVGDQRQVLELAESHLVEIVSAIDGPPIEGRDSVIPAPSPATDNVLGHRWRGQVVEPR
jgi:hypothetical protein